MKEKIKALQVAIKDSNKTVRQLTKEFVKAEKSLAKANTNHEKLVARLAKLVPAVQE